MTKLTKLKRGEEARSEATGYESNEKEKRTEGERRGKREEWI